MRPELPTGTVTFLFTDIEGSTRLLHSLGPEAYAEALAEHRRLLREACAAHGGVEVDTQGDAFFVAFPTAGGAAAAALDGAARARRRLRSACAWGFTRERRPSRPRDTWASTCTAAHESRASPTGRRRSSPLRPRRSSTECPSSISAATLCGTSTAQPVSSSSERDDIHPCAPLAPSSCRTPPHPSSAATGSSSRPCPSCSSATRRCSRSSGRAVPARPGSRSSWHACWQRRQAGARTSFHSRRYAIPCGSSPRSPRRSGPRSAIRVRSRRGSPASGRTSCSTTSSSCCRTRDPPSRPSSVPRRVSG